MYGDIIGIQWERISQNQQIEFDFIPGSSIDLYYGYYGIYTIEE